MALLSAPTNNLPFFFSPSAIAAGEVPLGNGAHNWDFYYSDPSRGQDHYIRCISRSIPVKGDFGGCLG